MVAKSGTDAGVRWKLAPALVKLVAQLDEAAPHRDRASDGSIASHQHHLANPRSDHEPHQFQDGEFVTAIDITHNPEHGVNCPYLWDALLKNKDKRIKYVIFNRRIFNDERFVTHTTGAKARGPWNPGPYDGSSPHTHHIHISIWGDTATDAGAWKLPEWLTLGQRQQHLDVLGQAQKVVDKRPDAYKLEGVAYTKAVNDTAAAIKAGTIDPDWWDAVEASLKAVGADSNSLTYALRFYRELAGRIGFDGAKPEQVANWLYGHISSLQLAVSSLKGEK